MTDDLTDMTERIARPAELDCRPVCEKPGDCGDPDCGVAELNLEEIKARAAHYAATPLHPGAYFTTRDSADDVPALVAEVERLRADLQARIDDHAMAAKFAGERLGLTSPLPAVTSIGCVQALAAHIDDEISEQNKRAEQAEAEVERLRKELEAERRTALLMETDVLPRCERRAERAEAAIERVRRLCEMTIATSIRMQAIDQARDTLALLPTPTPTEEPTP